MSGTIKEYIEGIYSSTISLTELKDLANQALRANKSKASKNHEQQSAEAINRLAELENAIPEKTWLKKHRAQLYMALNLQNVPKAPLAEIKISPNRFDMLLAFSESLILLEELIAVPAGIANFTEMQPNLSPETHKSLQKYMSSLAKLWYSIIKLTAKSEIRDVQKYLKEIIVERIAASRSAKNLTPIQRSVLENKVESDLEGSLTEGAAPVILEQLQPTPYPKLKPASWELEGHGVDLANDKYLVQVKRAINLNGNVAAEVFDATYPPQSSANFTPKNASGLDRLMARAQVENKDWLWVYVDVDTWLKLP